MRNINKWGIYRWFIEYGKEKIHQDDFEYFQKNINNFCVVECIDTIDDFLVIKYNDKVYRVKGHLSLELPEPKFKFGDVVTHKNSKNIVIEGVIADVVWHATQKNIKIWYKILLRKTSNLAIRNYTDKIHLHIINSAIKYQI